MVGRFIVMKGEPTSFDFEDDDRSLVEYYLDNTNHEAGTENNYRLAWRKLAEFVEKEGIEVREIDEQRAAKFCEFLKQGDSLSERTAELRVQTLSNMIDWYTTRGVLDYNPFSMALSHDPFSYRTETIKREISVDELRVAIQDRLQPVTLTFIVLLLKTGLRLSEVCNLDHRDINLDHPLSDEMVAPRSEIIDKPDTLYVDSSISEGEVHNGELREDGNKPYSYRAIPIDDELKQTLVWYVSMAPSSPSDAEPLLRKTHSMIGGRFSTYTLREQYFTPWAEDQGWHDTDRSDSVTPHWCRHWFTTMLRRRIDYDEVKMGGVDDYIKGLRGDSGNDVIETYTHSWGDNQWMRDAYINNIPSLFPD
jgi:integrase/recombinase XerC